MMKRNRTLPLLLAVCMILLMAYGCTAAPMPETTNTPEPSEAPYEPVDVNVMALKGPTGMGIVSLMEKAENNETKDHYTISLASAPDDIVGKIVTGEVDIAAVPINLASTLYAKTEGDVEMLAIHTLGVLYVLENGDTIQSISDLAGKTIYATGQGSTPEYILSYLLEKNGLTDQVKVEYLTEHSELAALVASGDVDIAVLPEPNVTATLLKNTDVRIALDLTKEWDAVADGTMLVQGCMIARKEFVENHPEAVKNFLEEYQASTSFTNDDPAAAAELIEQYGIMASAAAAEKSIPNCNIVYITGDEMVKSAKAMFEVLYAANPKSIGGALPDDALYYLP